MAIYQAYVYYLQKLPKKEFSYYVKGPSEGKQQDPHCEIALSYNFFHYFSVMGIYFVFTMVFSSSIRTFNNVYVYLDLYIFHNGLQNNNKSANTKANYMKQSMKLYFSNLRKKRVLLRFEKKRIIKQELNEYFWEEYSTTVMTSSKRLFLRVIHQM